VRAVSRVEVTFWVADSMLWSADWEVLSMVAWAEVKVSGSEMGKPVFWAAWMVRWPKSERASRVDWMALVMVVWTSCRFGTENSVGRSWGKEPGKGRSGRVGEEEEDGEGVGSFEWWVGDL
jgi:hypothetical protein